MQIKMHSKHMLKAFAFIMLLIVTTSLKAQNEDVYLFTSFREPSIGGLRYLYSYDGLRWDSIPGEWMKPTIGNREAYIDAFTGECKLPAFAPEHRVLRDPSICVGRDGVYHMVWTTAWQGSKGFGYAHSLDLINWSEQVEIPVMQNEVTNNVWAPEVFYDDDYDTYFIIWSSMLDPAKRTAADNLGTNNAQRLWYTTTKDFKTFAKARPYYDPGFNSIDAFLVKRAKRDYVLIVKDNRKPGFSNLFCAFASSPHGPFHTQDNSPKGTTPTTTFGRTFSEGPCCIKLGNEWVIYFDQYKPQGYAAVSTTDFKTFKPLGEQLSVPKGHKHGTVIRVPRKTLQQLMNNVQ